MIKRDIVKYFAKIKQATPSYYYFKKRNQGVMDYIFKEHSGNIGPFGDLRLYFGNFKNFSNKQLSCIKEINKNLLLILAKDQKAKLMIKAIQNKAFDVQNEREILDFDRAFKSITGNQKYDIDRFIDSSSYFNKSIEEIKMLFQAFQQPDLFKDILRSFNLSEETYHEPDNTSQYNFKKEKAEIVKNVYLLIHDLHKTAELPEINEPLSKLEEDVVSGRSKSQAIIHAKNLKLNKEKKKVDHLKNVLVKDQNMREKKSSKFEKFLKKIDEIESRPLKMPKFSSSKFLPKISYSSVNPFGVNPNKMKSVDRAFNSYWKTRVGNSTIKMPHDKERAMRNWTRVKELIKSPSFAPLKSKHITRTLKQLGKDGKLNKVINALINEMESEEENCDEINSDGEFWKSEPVDGYNVRPTFVPLLPISHNQIDMLTKLSKLNMKENSDFIESIQIRSELISQIQKHIYLENP